MRRQTIEGARARERPAHSCAWALVDRAMRRSSMRARRLAQRAGSVGAGLGRVDAPARSRYARAARAPARPAADRHSSTRVDARMRAPRPGSRKRARKRACSRARPDSCTWVAVTVLPANSTSPTWPAAAYRLPRSREATGKDSSNPTRVWSRPTVSGAGSGGAVEVSRMSPALCGIRRRDSNGRNMCDDARGSPPPPHPRVIASAGFATSTPSARPAWRGAAGLRRKRRWNSSR